MAAAVTPKVPGWIDRDQFPFESRYMRVDGNRMHYVDEGRGNPIVFIHGTPAWSYVYRRLLRELSLRHRCIAVDLIGAGLSDKPLNWTYTPSSQARAVGMLIRELGLENVTLVLHDIGGPIGLSYAVDHTDNVAGIVLMNTWCWDLHSDPLAHAFGMTVSGFLGKFFFEASNLAPRVVSPLFANKSRITEEFRRAIFGPFEDHHARHAAWQMSRQVLDSGAIYNDIWERLSNLDGKPILLVWGKADRFCGPAALNRFWHAFPLATVEAFDDAGHFVMEERPLETLRSIDRFLIETQSAVPIQS